jgi:DNA polymerase V
VSFRYSDGCIVACTNEAKALGLKMGDPYFKIRAFLERNGVAAFSSNYTLYGELSHRMAMATASLVSAVEQYSIDKNKLHTVDAQS